MSRESKLIVDELIAAMQARPNDFRIDRHTIKDGRTGMEFWIVNGPGYAGVYQPFEMKFGYWQGSRFLRAVNAFKACRAAAALIKGRAVNAPTVQGITV